MNPADPVARAEAVYAIIVAHIGKPSPINLEIANTLGIPKHLVSTSIERLRRDGMIDYTGKSGNRVLTVIGRGSCLARHVVALGGPEIARVENWTCPRCGARSGNCSHTAVSLSTTSLRAGWQRYAA